MNDQLYSLLCGISISFTDIDCINYSDHSLLYSMPCWLT